MLGILKALRLFKDIFREDEAFDYKWEAFIKVPRIFENIKKKLRLWLAIWSFFKEAF
jgi:hypothetical protein